MTSRPRNVELLIEDRDRSSEAEIDAAPHALPGECTRFELGSAR